MVGQGQISSGTYLDSFVGLAQPADFVLAEFKAFIFGFVATIVAAHKGLTARGGPKGVADGVNQAVVLSVILLAVINVGLTQAYVMLFPRRCLMSEVQLGRSFGSRVSDAWSASPTGVMKSLATLGDFVTFAIKVFREVPATIALYPPKETLRQIKDIAWGSGALLVGGGTVGVMILLSVAAGTSIGIEGFNGLEIVGLAPRSPASSRPVPTPASSHR